MASTDIELKCYLVSSNNLLDIVVLLMRRRSFHYKIFLAPYLSSYNAIYKHLLNPSTIYTD